MGTAEDMLKLNDGGLPPALIWAVALGTATKPKIKAAAIHETIRAMRSPQRKSPNNFTSISLFAKIA